MRGVNKAILIGNLGADPECRGTASGGLVANIRLATSRKWRDRDGNDKEATEWHSVVMWDKLAELAQQYLTKGDAIYIEGRIKTKSWVTDHGEKRYRTEVIAHEMTFLGGDGAKRQPAGGATPHAHQARVVASTDGPRPVEGTGDVGPKSNPWADQDMPF